MAPATADEDLVFSGPSADSRWAGLPLADMLEPHPDGSRHYATTTIDDRGRLADRTPLKIMGWEPGTPATISMIPVVGIILVRRDGPDAVTRQGHLRLPADIRHGCRLRGGDRLLVAAHPTEGILLAYAPFAVDAMTLAYHVCAPTEDVE